MTPAFALQQLARLEVRELAWLSQVLDEAYLNLERSLINDFASLEAATGLGPEQRAMLLTHQNRALMKLIQPEREREIKQRLTQLFGESSSLSRDLSLDMINKLGSVKATTSLLDPRLLRTMAQTVADDILGLSLQYTSQARNIIAVGMASDWGVRQTTDALRQRLGVTKSYATTAVRTYTMEVFNGTAEQNYRDSGVEYVQVLSINDSRRCAVCSFRHELIYRLGEIHLPFHRSCRCVYVPLLSQWIEDGLAAGSTPKPGRSPLSEFERLAGLDRAPEPLALALSR